MMTNLTWTTSELHTNALAMAETEFGDRILAGACVLAFALGLATAGIKPELVNRRIRSLAVVGYEEVRFKLPLRPGDTVYVESEVTGLKRTSREGRAVLSLAERLRRAPSGDVLVEYVRKVLCESQNGFD